MTTKLQQQRMAARARRERKEIAKRKREEEKEERAQLKAIKRAKKEEEPKEPPKKLIATHKLWNILCEPGTIKADPLVPSEFCYYCFHFLNCTHQDSPFEMKFNKRFEKAFGWNQLEKKEIDSVYKNMMKAVLEYNHELLTPEQLDYHLNTAVERRINQMKKTSKNGEHLKMMEKVTKSAAEKLRVYFNKKDEEIPEMTNRELSSSIAILQSGMLKYNRETVLSVTDILKERVKSNSRAREGKKVQSIEAERMLAGKMLNTHAAFDEAIKSANIANAQDFLVMWSLQLLILYTAQHEDSFTKTLNNVLKMSRGYNANCVSSVTLDPDCFVSLNGDEINVAATVENIRKNEMQIILTDGREVPYQELISVRCANSKNKENKENEENIFVPIQTALLDAMLKIGINTINSYSSRSYALNREIRKRKRNWYDMLEIFQEDPLKGILKLNERETIPEKYHLRHIRLFVQDVEWPTRWTPWGYLRNKTRSANGFHHDINALRISLETWQRNMVQKNEYDLNKDKPFDYECYKRVDIELV